MRISSHYLLHILLFGLGLLLTQSLVIGFSLCTLIDHFRGDLILHLLKLGIHRNCVHTVHYWLARHTIKAYFIVWTVVILIIVKGTSWQIDAILSESSSRLEVILILVLDRLCW